MGIEYTIKRKSFSQTYSTRHLTRLLCFFTTNLRVINKNKATKTKMYITFSYIVGELLGTEKPFSSYNFGIYLSKLRQDLHIYICANFTYVNKMQQFHCMSSPLCFSTARLLFGREYWQLLRLSSSFSTILHGEKLLRLLILQIY